MTFLLLSLQTMMPPLSPTCRISIQTKIKIVFSIEPFLGSFSPSASNTSKLLWTCFILLQGPRVYPFTAQLTVCCLLMTLCNTCSSPLYVQPTLAKHWTDHPYCVTSGTLTLQLEFSHVQLNIPNGKPYATCTPVRTIHITVFTWHSLKFIKQQTTFSIWPTTKSDLTPCVINYLLSSKQSNNTHSHGILPTTKYGPPYWFFKTLI